MFKRVLAYWMTKRTSSPIIANFSESLVDILRNENSEEDEVYVSCSLRNDCLILSTKTDDNCVLLKRPPFCPIKNLAFDMISRLSPNTKQRGVNVGVAVLLQSADNFILLTKRCRAMRTFPNVWVPPGGHIELQETLEDAGLRELHEETGITIAQGLSTTRILGLWESSFPPSLATQLLPKRHHVVVYLLAKDTRSAEELNSTILLQEDEVEQCAWLCHCLARKIVQSDSQFTNPPGTSSGVIIKKNCCSENCALKLHSSVIGASVLEGQTKFEPSIDTQPMLSQFSHDESDAERVSTGTKFALKLWIENNTSHSD